ncbi:winged helix-turn-helix transcriptional regulator [Altererythrobacter salegens]|uniref:Winged helix-turn-helix transcriptional regulator n=1 Tax=Croceibacterium salegens TaxID=1737568 RepID=A0A6I4SUI2_9SPHN|nr:MarR family transcriptional regulator [Croceibacterium salegens]MXO59625.1 winged helix-turn-helix transcriptional regulator [Croceibacterium salegens]
MAEEAVSLIETFTLGALARARRHGNAAVQPGAEFFDQLSLILNSLEPSVQGHASPASDGSPLIFQSELWQVLHKMRESAELSYAREVDLVELDRRILFLLRTKGSLVPADLSSAVGVDKAQVSRSVKRLLELRIVEREQIRSPVVLTRKGEQLADRLLRLADLRNRELIFDVGDDELEQFFATIEVLLKRSAALYEQERARANARDSGEAIDLTQTQRRGDEAILVDRARIMSPLLTLSAYFSRSGALAFKRSTGLSNFEAWVLNEIGRASPIDWPTLTSALQRDHSQAGRTVKALMDRGLIARDGRPGRRHGKFYPTPEGQRLYNLIQETSVERSSFLMAPLGEEERNRFLATFDKLRRNAVAQLERERALEELDRD